MTPVSHRIATDVEYELEDMRVNFSWGKSRGKITIIKVSV